MFDPAQLDLAARKHLFLTIDQEFLLRIGPWVWDVGLWHGRARCMVPEEKAPGPAAFRYAGYATLDIPERSRLRHRKGTCSNERPGA